MPPLQDGAMRVPFRVLGPAGPASGVARIDSGADRSILDPALAAEAGGVPLGSRQEVGIDGTPVQGSLYQLDLVLPGVGTVPGVRWVALPLRQAGLDVDALIGVNALRRMRMRYNGPAGVFALQTPGYTSTSASLPMPTAEKVALAVTGIGLIGLIVGVVITATD